MTARHLIALAVVLALGIPAGAAAEPWGDPRLPVRDGLELWLDASRLTAAGVAEWRDGSGHGRHLR